MKRRKFIVYGAAALGVTALCAQTQTKETFESVAKQRFQKFLCGSFDRELL